MRGPAYSEEFYRAEISRLTAELTQPISAEYRVQAQRELASARAHLAELQTPRTA